MMLAEPTPLDLEPPPQLDAVLRHDATFVAWDRGLTTARDVVNHGIRAINQVGAGLPELPEGSLEELLVAPLTGDHQEIRRNAEACRQVERALVTWTGNLSRLAATVAPAWQGQSAAAYLVRLGTLGVAGRAVAELVGEGAGVLEEIAEFSERLAVEVEGLVVELAESLARLVRKLLTRVGGPGGWALLAAELAVRGLDAVTDIVDDIRHVLALVDTLLELQDTVTAWVAEQRPRLLALRGLPELVGATF